MVKAPGLSRAIVEALWFATTNPQCRKSFTSCPWWFDRIEYGVASTNCDQRPVNYKEFISCPSTRSLP